MEFKKMVLEKYNLSVFRISKIFFGSLCFFIYIQSIDGLGVGSGTDGNLRLCVVEGRGTYKKISEKCPILERDNSGIECVLGHDRLDCLRRIGKGTVDFGVFYPEDLIAAAWADIDILVTNELKLKSEPHEYEIVALIRKEAGAAADGVAGVRAVLKGTTMCHPGYGVSEDFSDALSNYLESIVTERSCDPQVSIAENKVRSSASFFKAGCKAGPWVPEKALDAELKSTYSGLCAACYSGACSAGDRYWGRYGVLRCLAEQAGDFAWARKDDVRQHFGFTGQAAISSADNFMYLCRDGSVMPLTNDTEPCIWVAKPWPVIAAKRKSSLAVSHIASKLESTSAPLGDTWRSALIALLDTYRALAPPLAPARAPLDYLAAAPGFRAAYSIASCSPPRYISVCTWSLAAQHACDWLAEAGRVLGAEPPLQCTRQPDMYACAAKTTTRAADAADVIIADSDFLVPAKRDYNLTPILYETTQSIKELNTVVPYAKDKSRVRSFADMRGRRIAIPAYDGVAWHSVVQTLNNLHLLDSNKCPYELAMAEFFGESCVPGIQNAEGLDDAIKRKLTGACREDAVAHQLTPDGESLRLLVQDYVDIAVLSLSTLTNFNDTNSLTEWYLGINSSDYRPICPTKCDDQYFYTTWSSIGQIYIRQDTSVARRQEISNAFIQLDQLFGKNSKFHSPVFAMYRPFDQRDVLFHERTKFLMEKAELRSHHLEKFPRNFEGTLDEYKYGICVKSNVCELKANLLSVVLVLAACFISKNFS